LAERGALARAYSLGRKEEGRQRRRQDVKRNRSPKEKNRTREEANKGQERAGGLTTNSNEKKKEKRK